MRIAPVSRYSVVVVDARTDPVRLSTVHRCLWWLDLVTGMSKGREWRFPKSKALRILGYLHRALYVDPVRLAPSLLKTLRCREYRWRERALKLMTRGKRVE